MIRWACGMHAFRLQWLNRVFLLLPVLDYLTGSVRVDWFKSSVFCIQFDGYGQQFVVLVVPVFFLHLAVLRG
jgi:phage-related holin